jgi:hypothetical protein
MKLMAASFVRQEEKRRFGIGAKPRRNSSQARDAYCGSCAEFDSLSKNIWIQPAFARH